MSEVVYPDIYASTVLSSLGLEFKLKNDVLYQSVLDFTQLDIEIFKGSLPTQQQFSDKGDELKLSLLILNYTQAVWTHLDMMAQTKDYQSAISCLSYISSLTVEWQLEADAFSKWRDQCWEYAYSNFNDWTNGRTQPISKENFIAGLPELVW